MSKRTSDLPPLTGIAHVIREMRYSEAFRQGLGLLLIPVYSLLAAPQRVSFAVGGILAIIGMLVRMYASGFIIKNKQLATEGPYSLVRHPLYTGNLLLLIGFTFASGQWWALLVSAVFWWFYYPPAIAYEDRKLHRIFDADWTEWSRDVPAVIPRSVRLRGGSGWSFQTSLKQNLEPVIAAFVLIWLIYIAFQLG